MPVKGPELTSRRRSTGERYCHFLSTQVSYDYLCCYPMGWHYCQRSRAHWFRGWGEFHWWEMGHGTRDPPAGPQWHYHRLCAWWQGTFYRSSHHLPVEPYRLRKSQRDYFFFVFQSPYTPIVLGHPWLTQHNPQIDWVKGSVHSWNLSCHVNCLVSAVPAVSSVSVFQEEPGDLFGVPEEYHDLRAVFSRSRATSLPPHRPYDCSIELLPGTMPPRGRLYSLSAPERGALENYLTESLAAGIIVPSSSPAGAGFFFVKKKDGSLRPCIDYRGLNDITVKNRYPLPLMSSAFEILQGAKVFTKLDLRNAYHWYVLRRETSGRPRLTLPSVTLSTGFYRSGWSTLPLFFRL